MAGPVGGVPIAPSAEGRDDLTNTVTLFAHHSSSHGGINVEIDAPAGVQVTVHLNDGLIADETVPES